MAGLYVKDKGGDQTSRRSAARRSRRWTRSSPATRRAPRRRTPTSSALRLLGGASSRRTSARSSRSTRSPRARRSCSPVAGQCGLGALDAAKEKGVQGIGVDADQGYLGDHIMTSARQEDRRGRLHTPSSRSRTTRSRAAGHGLRREDGRHRRRQDQRGRREVQKQVDAQQEKIASGELDRHPDTSRSRTLTRPHRSPSSCGASRSASARSWPTTAWTSTCAAARSTPCWGRTARASRR